jgi:predicted nuclease with RNAse H fold
MNKIEIPKEVFENIFFAEGGQKKDLHKAMTGEYQFALNMEKPIAEPNAEVEGGEYILDSRGIRKFEGKSHEKGGMPVKLEEGSRIISNHLKIGVELAKELSKSLKLPFKATDTYAKALDRFTNASGLTKVNEELQKLISKMDEQKSNSNDKETFALNNQFLNNAINNKNKEKEPLEKERAKFFDMIFKKQEESKKEESEYKMEMGGDYLGIASKHSISPERAKELLKNLPHYQNATPEYTDKYRRERFKDFVASARAAGYEGDVDMNAKDLGPEAGKLQKFMVENYPERVRDYFEVSGQPLTAKHVDLLKAKSPWAFKVTGIPANKPSASYTDEEKLKLKKAFAEADENQSVAGEDNKNYNNFILEGFNDEKWDWRYPVSPILNKSSIKPAGAKITATLPTVSKMPPPAITKLETPLKTPDKTPVKELEKVKDKNRRGLLLLPDQTPLMPSSIQPSLKIQRRYSRIGYNDISPEQALTEMNRSEVGTQNQLKDMSPQQRAAASVALTANANTASNKVIADVNRTNAAGRNAVDVYNAKVSDAEENAAGSDALDYEKRTYMAQNAYEQNLNNFYNKLQKNQMNNWKTVEGFNRYNALNPDVQFTGEGYEVNNNIALTPSEMKYIEELRNPTDTKTKTKAKTKTATAKFGGRFKK